MDEIPETLLLFGRQRNFVPTDLVVGGKTVVKVCFGAAKGDQVRRVDRKDDAFVGCFVQLGKIVTFELVDKEDVAGRKIIKPVVNQKLPAARDRVIDLVGASSWEHRRCTGERPRRSESLCSHGSPACRMKEFACCTSGNDCSTAACKICMVLYKFCKETENITMYDNLIKDCIG